MSKVAELSVEVVYSYPFICHEIQLGKEFLTREDAEPEAISTRYHPMGE